MSIEAAKSMPGREKAERLLQDAHTTYECMVAKMPMARCLYSKIGSADSDVAYTDWIMVELSLHAKAALDLVCTGRPPASTDSEVTTSIQKSCALQTANGKPVCQVYDISADAILNWCVLADHSVQNDWRTIASGRPRMISHSLVDCRLLLT